MPPQKKSRSKTPSPVDQSVTAKQELPIGESIAKDDLIRFLNDQAQTVLANGREGKVESELPEYHIIDRQGQRFLESVVVFEPGNADVPKETEGDRVESWAYDYVTESLPSATRALMEASISVDE